MKKSFLKKLLLLVIPLAVIFFPVVYAFIHAAITGDQQWIDLGTMVIIAVVFIIGGIYLVIYEIGMGIHYSSLKERGLDTKEAGQFLKAGLLLFIIGAVIILTFWGSAM